MTDTGELDGESVFTFNGLVILTGRTLTRAADGLTFDCINGEHCIGLISASEIGRLIVFRNFVEVVSIVLLLVVLLSNVLESI